MKQGWAMPGVSRKFHYFLDNGFSLCRKIGFYMGETDGDENDDGKGPRRDDCSQCYKLRQSMKSKEKTNTP